MCSVPPPTLNGSEAACGYMVNTVHDAIWFLLMSEVSMGLDIRMNLDQGEGLSALNITSNPEGGKDNLGG